MHLVDLSVGMLGSTPIVGSSLPVAVGTAFASWLRSEKKVTVAFFGEGATEEGVFSESLNFAALKKLPVVFVCENNLYSVYSALSVRQAGERDNVGIARAHGVYGAKGDGNDVEEVSKMATEAVNRARSGEGPTFLEFLTYRWREHCGPNYDNDLGYRTDEEFESWKKQCPIERYQHRLMTEKIIAEEEIVHMREKIKTEIEEAFSFAQASAFPHDDKLAEGIYADGVTQ